MKALLKSPASDEPGHRDAHREITSEVRETDLHRLRYHSRNDRPRQSQGEEQTEVPPGAHVPHHRHPTQALQYQVTDGMEVGYGINPIPQQLHFIPLLGDQPPDQQIIPRTVLDRLE